MGKINPRPDGGDFVRGDAAPMPNRGTETGCQGDNGDYGADVSEKAINRMGGISGTSKSHSAESKPGAHNRMKGC